MSLSRLHCPGKCDQRQQSRPSEKGPPGTNVPVKIWKQHAPHSIRGGRARGEVQKKPACSVTDATMKFLLQMSQLICRFRFVHFVCETRDQCSCRHGPGSSDSRARPQGEKSAVASVCGGGTHRAGQHILQRVRENYIFLARKFGDESIRYAARGPS